MQLTDRQTQVLATIATITAVSMYVSYIPQIQMNLAGQKGSALQPLVAAINCTLWVIYALFKPQRDIPVALANAPGIVLGLITFWTAQPASWASSPPSPPLACTWPTCRRSR